jgi:Ca2+-binding EF-hand superfamily protein
MFRSATEGQLPVLPGIRQYVPKRSAHGRHSLFDCDKSGAMMHKEKMSRPASTPSSQQNLGGSMGRLSSSTLLRPQSALGSSKSLAIFEDPPAGLTQTTRKKQQTINSLKALEPLAINQQRVALQRQLRQLEQTEAQMFKENQSTNQLNRSASALAGSVLPRWVKMDREVLRWYCYSKESVPESAYETFRIRKFILYYYLVDGTIRINEPKVKNSGLPGGDVYKRSAMLKRNGTPYGPEDFTTGAEFEICARVYRIVDCDAQTMKHFTKKLGMEFGYPEQYPTDPFVESQKFSDEARMKNPKLSRRITNEALLGGRPGLIGYRVTRDLENWMKNDGKQLKFECVWDDTDRYNGKSYKFQMVYYLEDDTIQIVRPSEKAGGNVFPVLVKRCRIPKDFTKRNEIPDNPLGRNQKKYYVAEDLKCGQFVNIFGRNLMICRVNASTFEWYKARGINQHAVDVEKADSRIIKHIIPPYNGWGSEADSLTSCMHLVPKPVKRDMLRFLESQGETLRFKAKLNDPKTPADGERRFVFTFYLEDLTVAIFEPAVANSGVIGGKYLERGEYKRSIREKTAEELNPFGARDNNPLVILLREKMQQYLSGGKYMLLEAFKHFGGGGQGSDNITLKEFKHGCMMCGMPTTMREARTLFGLYDEDGSGNISFQEFVDGVMESDYGLMGSDASKSTARWLRPSDFTIGNVVRIQFPRTGAETPDFKIISADGYTLSMMEMNPQDFPKSNVEYIIKELATKLAQFNVNVHQEFKTYDQDRTGTISEEQFKSLLNKWAKDLGFVDEDLQEQDLVTLVRNFDEDGDGSISYAEFCDALTAAPIAFRNEVDENHLEKAERKLYNEFHDHPTEDLVAAFSEMDEHGDGQITMDEFHRFLEHHGIEVSDEETAAIMLHYDKDVKGWFNYQDFISVVKSPHFLGSKGLSKKQKKHARKMQSYKSLCSQMEQEKGHVAKIETLLKKFTRYFFRKKSVLKKRFLSHDYDGKGIVNKDNFVKSIHHASGNEFPEKYLNQLVQLMFPSHDSGCPYQEFMDVAFRGDVQSFNGLIQRRCNFHDTNTWGKVVFGFDDAFDNHC